MIDELKTITKLMNKYFHTLLLGILTILSGCIDIKLKELNPASDANFSFYYTGPETYAKNTTTINLVPTTSAPGFSNYTTTGTLPNGVTLNPSTGTITGTPTQNLALTVFTIQAIAPNGNPVSTQVNLTVNDNPVISSVSNFSINEDTSSGAINFSISDNDDTLTCSGSVTATSSNTSVISNSALVIGGVAPNCTISLAPVMNQSGIVTITLVANDPHSTTSSSFDVTVSPVDDAPVASNITPAAFNEDTQSIITLSYSDPDLDQATACNISALNNVTVTQSCGCTSGVCTVGVTGTSNYNGPASFNYTITANAQTSAAASVTLSINPVDDAPVAILLTPAAFNEDTESIINLSYSDIEGNAASSCSLSSLTHITVSTPCTCTLGSCSVGVTGTSNYNGVASFSYTVSTGLLVSNSALVSLTISAVNDAPVMAAISSKTVTRDTSTSSISVTVSDVDSVLTCGSSISMTTSNTSLVLGTAVVWGGTAPNCSAVITPVQYVIGSLDVSFSVTDGTLSSLQTFALTVEPIAPSAFTFNGRNLTKDRNVLFYRDIITGTNLTYSITSGTLPTGLQLSSSDGFIHGTPTTVESQTITVKAENSMGSLSSTFTLNVIEVAPSGLIYPDIQTWKDNTLWPSLTSGSDGSSFTLSSGILPPGYSLDTSTGYISGAALLTGHHNKEFPVSIRVCNGAGCSDESVVLRTIFNIIPGALPTGAIGSFTGYEPTYSKIAYVTSETIRELEISDPKDPNNTTIIREVTTPTTQDFVKAYAHDLNGDGLNEIILLSTDNKIHIFSVDTNGNLEFSYTILTQLPVGSSAQLSGSLDFGELDELSGIDILLTTGTGTGTTGIEIFGQGVGPGEGDDGSFFFYNSRLYSTLNITARVGTFLWNSNLNGTGTVVLDYNADGASDIALTDAFSGEIGIIYGPIIQPGNSINFNVVLANSFAGGGLMASGFDLKAKSIDNIPGDEIIFLYDSITLSIINGSGSAEKISLTNLDATLDELTALTITPSGFFVDYIDSSTTPTLKTAMFSIDPQLNIVPRDVFKRDIQRADFATPQYFQRVDIGGVRYSGLLETAPDSSFIYRLESP